MRITIISNCEDSTAKCRRFDVLLGDVVPNCRAVSLAITEVGTNFAVSKTVSHKAIDKLKTAYLCNFVLIVI